MTRPPLVLGTVTMSCPQCGETPHELTMLVAGWATAPCRCEAACSECGLVEPLSLAIAGEMLLGTPAQTSCQACHQNILPGERRRRLYDIAKARSLGHWWYRWGSFFHAVCYDATMGKDDGEDGCG